MQNVYLLVKPASGRCQLRCGYCFYRDETLPRQARDRGFMTLSTLEAVVREGLAYAGREVTFAFQGGEPTLAGLAFFEAGAALQNLYKELEDALRRNVAPEVDHLINCQKSTLFPELIPNSAFRIPNSEFIDLFPAPA